MVSVEQALGLVQQKLGSTQSINLDLSDALDYCLAEDIVSRIDMPPFRQAAMDGYALFLSDNNNYNLIGEVQAGDSSNPSLTSGMAVRIFTGAAVPDTANAVIMQEHVTVDATEIMVMEDVTEGKNIRSQGEQVQKGAIALKKGVRLCPAAIGYLSSLGVTNVAVYKKPKIAIVTTGDELVAPGKDLDRGQIYESNGLMLKTALRSLGYEDVQVYRVADDYKATETLLGTVISKNDLVLVSGGISVGDYDFVGEALNALDVDEIFYKVKQKPGKPLFFGMKNEKLIFALPGNPASALTCFYVYVHPALQQMSGDEQFKTKTISANITSPIQKKGDRAQFLKAQLVGTEVTIMEGQSSAMLHTFALANALVYIPADVDAIDAGDLVETILIPN